MHGDKFRQFGIPLRQVDWASVTLQPCEPLIEDRRVNVHRALENRKSAHDATKIEWYILYGHLQRILEACVSIHRTLGRRCLRVCPCGSVSYGDHFPQLLSDCQENPYRRRDFGCNHLVQANISYSQVVEHVAVPSR